MNAISFSGIPPGDPEHEHFGAAVAWLRAHHRLNPRDMIPTISGLIDRISALEAANAVASEAVGRAESEVAHLTAHNVRLRTEIARLKVKLIENGAEDHESGR